MSAALVGLLTPDVESVMSFVVVVERQRLQYPDVHSKVQSSPNLSTYRHIMGQMCPSGRKTDYTSCKDGAAGAQTNYFARNPSERFLRGGVPVSHPQRKYYQIEF